MRQRIFLGAVIAIMGMVSMAMADTTPATGTNWPKMTTASNGAQITIFQPQLDDFQGDQLSAHAAVAVQMPGQSQPTYGAVWLQSQVSTDRVARTVQILQVNIPKTLFPGFDAPTTAAITQAIQQELMASPPTLSLDQLLEMLQAVQTAQQQVSDLANNPPQIVFYQHAVVEVQFDGAPRLMDVPNSSLLRAVNTPFYVVLDPSSKIYYLKGAGRWFTAPDALGPYSLVGAAPQNVVDLAQQSGYTDPEQPVSDEAAQALQIVTATSPTEAIWTDGPFQMTPISGTNLLYVANTESDVFVLIPTQQMYVLLSGRWFTAANQNGPWTYVASNQLPPDFAQIPAGSAKANVLAFVPGTQAAQDATANTYIPQTAAIDTSNYQQPPVDYDGDPNFAPIGGTSLTYAQNCPCPVIGCNGAYYCCYNAVWYQCATPRGHWDLCRHVPPPIYAIPPSCPVYPVRYCYVYGATPTVVYVGYTPGYTGCYATGGVVVYGTGYYYNAWAGNVYIPRPLTFGFGARYDPYSGHWGFGFALATGGGGLWIGSGANLVVHGGGWFGYGGYRPTLLRASAHPDILAAPERVTPHSDLYERNLYQSRGDVREIGQPGEVVAPRPAEQPRFNSDVQRQDVYADRDGNVYRHTDSGWETRQGDDWRAAPQESYHEPSNPQPREESSPDRGSPDNGQLDRDRTARVEGEQRTESAPREQQPSPAGRDSGGRSR
jgi:hypothetical protein